MLRTLCFVLSLIAGTAQAQDQPNPVQFPTRVATEPDIKLLESPQFAAVKQELGRIGLHQNNGRTCTTFVTADSVRLLQSPLPLDGSPLTLPYASFLMWSPDRLFRDAVLYHVFAAADAAYTQPQKIPPGATKANREYHIVLAKREPYPTAAEVASTRDALAAGPFRPVAAHGAGTGLSVQPYLIPTEKDEPASTLPQKDEHTLQVTCLSDPGRVTNCLCAGTE